MDSFGQRLQKERKRLRYTQDELAQLVGTTRKTQSLYENDARYPDARYLMLLAEHGGDVLYVLTGRQAIRSSDEHDDFDLLLDAYEVISERVGNELNKKQKRTATFALFDLYKTTSAGINNDKLADTVLKLIVNH